MCGITGIWSRTLDRDQIREDLRAAVASLRHRGPDDDGIWIGAGGLGLGFTRLAILDLTPSGHQPMVSADGRHIMVFNGEIYNFASIRSELEALGHEFTSTGDTEVILHAFKEWGADAVSRFIGMFAIALWDERERTLMLVRDRVGVKPLYYGHCGSDFVFGSELKAIRAFRGFDNPVNPQAIGEFLQFGFISGDRSIYEGIHKLLPGHRLFIREGHAPRLEPYWRVTDAFLRPPMGDVGALEGELEELLVDAFQRRLVSDVPVGVFLSGGIDSSLLTAILAQRTEHEIRTFTIGFAESKHDESGWARRVADHCGTRHTEYRLSINDALGIAKDWGSLFDEPFGDSSGIPTLMVSRLAANDVKVVLSADGGDELFGGYNSYDSVLERLRGLDRIPGVVRRTASGLMNRIPLGKLDRALETLGISPGRRVALVGKGYRLGAMLAEPTAGRLMELVMSHWRPDEIASLMGTYENPRPSADEFPGSPLSKITLWDFHNYLPEDILTKVDRTTMATSIEGREPLLDHRIAELAFRLPDDMRRGALGPKHILKKILFRYVPRELVDRPKQGFSIPLEQWLRTDLRELVMDYLSPERIKAGGYFDPTGVTRLLDRFYGGAGELKSQLWFLLAFEMWRERWN